MDTPLPTQLTSPTPSPKVSKKTLLFLTLCLLFLSTLSLYIYRSFTPQQGIVNQSIPNKPIPTPPVKSGEFISVVRWEKTLPESLKKSHPQTKMTVDGQNFIREYATIKEVIKEGTYRLNLLTSNQQITASVDDKTLIAKAFYGYDSNNTLTNIQYHGLSKDGLTKVKKEELILVAHPENDKSQLSEFVFVEQ